MSRMIAGIAAVTVLGAATLPLPARADEQEPGAATRTAQTQSTELSSQRRHWRHGRYYGRPYYGYRRYYGPRYGYYGGYPHYGYGYPYGYYRPGVTFGFGPFGFVF